MPHEGQTGVIIQSGAFRLMGSLFLAKDDTPKPTALILHGIPGIEKNYDIAHMLRDRGWNSLIFHYRGCWGSEGSYVLKTIPDDIKAAVDWLHNGEYPQIDTTRLIVIGHSLGGWAAGLSAARDVRIRAVAVYSAVTDPPTVNFDEAVAREDFSPWLVDFPPDECVRQWQALDEEFSAVAQAHRIAPRPMLVIHSRVDADVAYEQGHQLAEAAGDNAVLVTHDEANHSFTWHREWLRAQLMGWIDNLDLI